jgi:hypothetical protein
MVLIFSGRSFCFCPPLGDHQENNNLLESLEPVSPVVPARQQISWTYVYMPDSSTCIGGENHHDWYQSLEVDPVHNRGTIILCYLFLVLILCKNGHNYLMVRYYMWRFR